MSGTGYSPQLDSQLNKHSTIKQREKPAQSISNRLGPSRVKRCMSPVVARTRTFRNVRYSVAVGWKADIIGSL